jgi:hypothetical protein
MVVLAGPEAVSIRTMKAVILEFSAHDLVRAGGWV